MRTTVVVSALLLVESMTLATEPVRVASAEALRRAFASARPGSIILIEPGEYRGYFGLRNLRATADRPTVIAAANPNDKPILRGTSECIHLTDVSHLVLRNLVLAGARTNGLNVDDGGSYDTASRHVVLDGLAVRDVGPHGNRDGIKLSGVDDVLVRGCTVQRWGSGGSAIDMVGCHRVLITSCTFLQPRERDRGGSGIQAKGGSADVLVYRCRFGDAGQRAVNLGGSTGLAYFRPADAGYEAKRVVVLGCTFVGGMAALAFVGCDEGEASYNTICRPARWVLRILQESVGERFVPCRNGAFRRNLVVWRHGELATTVNIGPNTAPKTFRFEGNWWYCEDAPSRSHPSLPVAERNGVVGRDPGLKGDGLSVRAEVARDHGAHAKAAADRFRDLAPELTPWPYAALKAWKE